MALWFTSDLHFGHENIIRYCGRPFSDANSMNSGIVDSINTHVGPEDDLWILGDLAMGNLESNLRVTRRLIAGTVTLVAGNHDRAHPYAARGNAEKQERWEADYVTEAGLHALIPGNTEMVLASGISVNVSHFPYAANSRESGAPERERSIDAYRPVDDGRWLLCGHVHEKWRQRGKCINVGIDAWGGRPVSEAELVTAINDGPQDLDVITWTSRKVLAVTAATSPDDAAPSRSS